MCVHDVVKNINTKVFNLMSRTNETRHMEWRKTCKCKFRLDARVCNNKQRWNNCKCRCECEKLIDKGICDKGFIWNPSNCECECDKSCDVGKYIDYENCEWRKRLVDKVVEEYNENIDENKLISVTLDYYKNVCGSCTIYIVVLVIFFIINISTSCQRKIMKDNANITNINANSEAVIYWTYKWELSKKLT